MATAGRARPGDPGAPALAQGALFAGALLSGWALWLQRDRDTGGATVAKRPDYVLHDFEVIVLNTEGKESFTLTAPRLERDPEARPDDGKD